MQLNINPKTQQTSFQALYMPPKKELTAKLGEYVAEQAEKARPELEKISGDLQMYIKPIANKNVENQGFDIEVNNLICQYCIGFGASKVRLNETNEKNPLQKLLISKAKEAYTDCKENSLVV